VGILEESQGFEFVPAFSVHGKKSRRGKDGELYFTEQRTLTHYLETTRRVLEFARVAWRGQNEFSNAA